MIDFPVSHFITLTGSPRQRGRTHGETLRSEIQELLASWKDWLVKGGRGTPDQYCQVLLHETGFLKAVERWTPGLLEEVKGIAEGAAVDFQTIFAFQLQDEEWWFGQEKKEMQPGRARGCSSIGLPKQANSACLIAQNMDMPDYLDNYQVVLHIKDDQSDVESFIFSVAGLLALNGANNHSLGIVCNNLSQLNHTKDGLPVAYVHRGVLEKGSYSEAVSFLESIQHASGQNYLLGSPSGIIDLECSANQVEKYSHPGRDRSICHTNHPFANTDLRIDTAEGGPTTHASIKSDGIKDLDSRIRFSVLYDQLAIYEKSEQANKDLAVRLLSSHDSVSHPVCRHSSPGNNWMTIGTSIMCLDEHPQLYICPGPPCTARFTQYSFN